MKSEVWLFSGGVLFFVPVAFVYGILTNWGELVGFVALLLTGGLAILVGGYLAVTAARIDERPEDNPRADVTEGAGEQGFFSPHSWWPLALSFGAALVFAGAAVGWWLAMIGAVLSVIFLIGWVFEYFVGEHAH
ncbi:cytochrome c oxidase subunit 4 [Kineococcus sp. NUM-3379]